MTTLTRSRIVLRRLVSVLRLSVIFPYLVGASFVGVATLVSYAAAAAVRSSDLTLIYLIAVVLSARSYGLWPSIFVSLLGILTWDFLFTSPEFSLYMSDERDVFTLATFMIVALIVSTMTSHIRFQNKQLNQLAANKSQLYAFSEKLAAIKTVEEISDFTMSHVAARLKRDAVMSLGDRFASTPNIVPDANSAGDDVIPLAAFRGRIGVIRIKGARDAPISPEDKQHVMAVLGQAAIAIERIWLAEEHEMSSLAAETERLRNALLISVSHDLRTPLTSIIGSLSTLETMDGQDANSSRNELTEIALSEAQRLDRFIGNLLDMTKLEFGGLDVKMSPVAAADIVDTVLQRSQKLLQEYSVAVHIQDKLPPAVANSALLKQALFNVIDNAAKYSHPNGEIEIRSFAENSKIVFQVADRGDGISDQLSKIIFTKFARAAQGDSRPPGTGLGLVIAKGFLEAMGGEITAANRRDGSGAIFSLRLPAFAPVSSG